MGSARTSGAVTGAAAGAVSGMALGAAYGSIVPVWGTVIGAAVGLVGGLISGGAADAAQKNQSAWAAYNANMQFKTDLYNIRSDAALNKFNIASTMAAARINSEAVLATADYNAAMTYATTSYNDTLMQQELDQIWQDEGLDLTQLEQFRMREKGNLVAEQAASGTTIGEGSNAAAVIDQTTQRAMDANVIMFNADRRAADISNKKAGGLWEGEVAINQLIWDGKMQAYSINSNAQIQAGSMAVGGALRKNAGIYTAKQQRSMSNAGIAMNTSQFKSQNTQNMVSGLFSAAASGASNYYKAKVPGAKTVGTAPKYLSKSTPAYSNMNLSLATRFSSPGSSLAVN